jgi:hypothetical protein
VFLAPRLTPARSGAFALLVAVALIGSAGTAAAGCGDHVTILNDDGSEAGHQPAGSNRPPCHGPNCSAQKPLPTAPVTVPLPPLAAGLESALTNATTHPGTKSRSGFPFDPSCGPPVHRPAAPFHPPRSV